jgi:hypothetical protein
MMAPIMDIMATGIRDSGPCFWIGMISDESALYVYLP